MEKENVVLEKKIPFKLIAEIQNYNLKLFEEEDEEFPDGRTLSNYNRAIERRLEKITQDEVLQQKILTAIDKGSWVQSDYTYKPICDNLRALGFDIVF